MKKLEALAMHDKTWLDNGVLTIKSSGDIQNFINKTSSCGTHCEKFTVKLNDTAELNASIYGLPEDQDADKVVDGDMKVAPQEMFDREIEDVNVQSEKALPPPQAFDKLVNRYYSLNS